MSSAANENMEFSDGVITPTPSQESVLLNDNENSVVLNTAPTKPVGKVERTATLSDVKRIMLDNAGSSGSETTISLHSGTVVVEKPHKKQNRNRSNANRNAAKNGGKSNVNPHERVQSDIMSNFTPAKRSREHGDTPPSANQLSKKSSVGTDTPGVMMKQNDGAASQNEATKSDANHENRLIGSVLSRSARRNRAKRLKKQNADKNLEPNGKDTPVQQNAQPSGSAPSGTNENQPIAPPGAQTHDAPVTMIDKDSATNTFAEIVKSHTMAIIDQRKPGHMQVLTEEKVNKINSLLTDMMLAADDSNTELPVFDDTRLHSGAMRLKCANDHTRKWLEHIVPTIEMKKLWTGAKLVVMEFKNIPKPYKFNVVFRSITKPPKDIFNLLERQNKNITTRAWTVLSHSKKGNDTHMTIGVCQDSFDVLRTCSNSLFCGMGRALFTMVKHCKENINMLQRCADKKLDCTKNAHELQQEQTQKPAEPTGEAMETDVDAGAVTDEQNEKNVSDV